MTVSEAIIQMQGSEPGFINRRSADYAQTLLEPEEIVTAAVVANIFTRKEHFPRVVVLTDCHILAVCGLPGIRRRVICDLKRLDKCVEKPTAITYSASFAAGENAFSMTIDPDTGEKFSRRIAVIKGGIGKEKSRAGYADPKAVAARLSAELAAEENKK